MKTLMTAAPTERVGRYPKHTFNVYARPFGVHPMLIAPVLPAETMKSMYFEARVVTDPLTNPIIGWKQEYYFFYVKMSDLLRDAIKNMFIDPNNADLAATLGAPARKPQYYTAKGAIPYVQYCLERVMVHYFRDSGEAWNSRMDGDIPICQIKESTWMDSLTDKDDMPEGAAIASATDMGDLDRLMDAFEHLRAMGLANMTYEDFLRSYGVSLKDPTEGKPEMIGRFADWQYPSNTVNPVDGTPSSAVSWVFKDSLRNRTFFTEPGFIFGVAVTRPKIYFGGQDGAMSGFLSRAWDWMPALLAGLPETKLKQFAADTGPLGDRGTATDAYWVDMCDLFIYGDQFLQSWNFNVDTNPLNLPVENILALPDATLNYRYPDPEMMVSFFANEGRKRVRMDGMCSFNILGKQIDNTETNLATA